MSRMYPSDKVKNIHRQLQGFFSSRPVLLGGSYLYSEASENSDLDFYVLDTFPWSIFFRRKYYARLLVDFKQKHEVSNVHILVVPRLFFNLGWYYIYGQTLAGKILISKINKKVIFRTALKLAHFHYIRFLNNSDDSVRLLALQKAAQQLAAARTVLLSQILIQPLFSRKNLLHHTDKLQQDPLLRELLALTSTPGQDTISSWGNGVRKLLADLAAQGKKFFSFSIVNYLVYNLRFLVKKSGKFLLTNPDALILKELQKAAALPTITEDQYNAFKEVVLPALIF